jgi:hypothetical protein
MKKLLFVLILVTHLVFGVFCQSANPSGPIDLVVLLDTSASMSGSYSETSNYLVGPFLREFLRIGDTFHLISFSGTPKLEISRRIEGIGDAETIIARLLLMYPLDPESNLSGALSFAESFAFSLPSRSKKIVLISDGDAENTQNLVNESSARFRGLGADLQYIRVPVAGGGPGSGRVSPAQTTTPSQSAQPSQTTQATQTAQQSTQPSQAAQATQTQTTQTTQTAQGTQATQTAQTTERALPSEAAQQTQSTSQAGSSQASGLVTTQESGPSGTVQSQPSAQSTGQTQASQASSGTSGITPGGNNSVVSTAINIPLPLMIALGILLLLILIGIIIFASRKLHKSPNRVISKAASSARAETRADHFTETRKTDHILEYPPSKMKPLPKDKVYDENTLSGEPILLNLFVADQNTAIGKRNIHLVKPGYSYTIGGGNSDFLIFLVPVPPQIAEVRHDGRNCTFTPRKPDYFPDIGSQPIPNCIGKTFRVISDKKYELHIRLEKYEDPLDALNKILRSIKVPGPAV